MPTAMRIAGVGLLRELVAVRDELASSFAEKSGEFADIKKSMCAEAGQLEINVIMPYVAYSLLECLELMKNAAHTFDEKCVRLLRAHPDRCCEYAELSVGNAALHNEGLGFTGASELAKRAIETGEKH